MHGFCNLLLRNIPSRSSHVAIIHGNTKITYADLLARSESAAALLRDLDVKKGDRIGVHFPKSITEIAATFGISLVDGVFVNIPSVMTSHQLQHIIRNAGIRILFTERRRALKLVENGMADDLEWIITLGSIPEHERVIAWDDVQGSSIRSTPRADATDLAALLYTSGSTGLPKGVMVSHQNLIEGAEVVASYLQNTSQDRVLGLLSMGFDYGLNQVTTTFLTGATIVLQSVAMPAEIVRTVMREQVTGIALVPHIWIQLIEYLEGAGIRLPSLRYITNTGGAIPRRFLEKMQHLFQDVDKFLMYGLTEAFRSTCLPPEFFCSKMGSIGKAIPGVEIFVVDSRSGICGPEEPGELLHSGNLISMGYWGNPQETDKRIRTNRHLGSVFVDSRVLHSGDIVTADVDGFLWFKGRSDAMIKSRGMRISPAEVEEIVYDSGRVSTAVAFGVADEMLGQTVHVIVRNEHGGTVDLGALKNYCRQNMPGYMVPAQFHLAEGSLPWTANGKLDRAAMVSRVRAVMEKIKA